MNWKYVDERLIRCSELLLSLEFLENYDFGLSVMSFGKVRHLFKFTVLNLF